MAEAEAAGIWVAATVGSGVTETLGERVAKAAEPEAFRPGVPKDGAIGTSGATATPAAGADGVMMRAAAAGSGHRPAARAAQRVRESVLAMGPG
jgi:hypothetical protein